MNLGLRFEVEQGMTETADRMITSSIRTLCRRSPTSGAAPARTPIPEVLIDAFRQNLPRGRGVCGRRTGRAAGAEFAGDVAGARIGRPSGERGIVVEGPCRPVRLTERDRDHPVSSASAQ